jgi:hypothetical protein
MPERTGAPPTPGRPPHTTSRRRSRPACAGSPGQPRAGTGEHPLRHVARRRRPLPSPADHRLLRHGGFPRKVWVPWFLRCRTILGPSANLSKWRRAAHKGTESGRSGVAHLQAACMSCKYESQPPRSLRISSSVGRRFSKASSIAFRTKSTIVVFFIRHVALRRWSSPIGK